MELGSNRPGNDTESSRTPLPNRTYMDRVVSDLTAANLRLVRRQEQGRYLPTLNLPRDWKAFEYSVIQDFYRLEKDSLEDEHSNSSAMVMRSTLVSRRRALLQQHGDKIVKEAKFNSFERLADWIERNKTSLTELGSSLLKNDLSGLYLAACKNKFLVGIKDQKPVFKKIALPEPHLWPTGYILNIGTAILSQVKNIGQRELEAIPSRILLPNEIQKVTIPEPARSVEDLLEDAYYHPHFMVPLEGAAVHFSRAGGLQRGVVFVSRGKVIGKLVAGEVESFIKLDLDTGEMFSSVDAIFNTNAFRRGSSRWAGILAETYHDLVIATEIPTQKPRPLGGSHRITPSRVERPHVIYIPRIIRKGESPQVRIPYDGPARSMTPHQVSGHLRKRPMTPEHEETLRKWQDARDLDILAMIPDGYTFVRPYTVPADDAEAFKRLPQFIKRRVESRLRDDLQRTINQSRPTNPI